MTFEVLYQDASLVAIRKPPGIHIHRSNLTPGEPAMVESLERQLGQKVFPVHRLDRPTSGAVVFALSSEVASILAKLWRERAVLKVYHAVVRGWLIDPVVVDHLVRLDREDQTATIEAQTELAPLEFWEPAWPRRGFETLRLSLIEARPVTGRRHQIRQHVRTLFHPILGDTIWGDTALNGFVRDHAGLDRLCLFCRRLEFLHPQSGLLMVIEAPATPDEMQLFNRLRDFSPHAHEKAFINSQLD